MSGTVKYMVDLKMEVTVPNRRVSAVDTDVRESIHFWEETFGAKVQKKAIRMVQVEETKPRLPRTPKVKLGKNFKEMVNDKSMVPEKIIGATKSEKTVET